jgi:hypothetical protein
MVVTVFPKGIRPFIPKTSDAFRAVTATLLIELSKE